MGPRQEAQAVRFYEFSLEDHVPQNHLLRSIDRFVDLRSIRAHLAEFYSHTGRPSIDPELMIRMLLVGYCSGIWSERSTAALRILLPYKVHVAATPQQPAWHVCTRASTLAWFFHSEFE